MRFVGLYNKHECAIEVSDLALSDKGEWVCEIESYVWGPLPGRTDKAGVQLVIRSKSDYNIQTSINRR